MSEERRLAAIMFADVCGYSRIMGENETRAVGIVEAAVSCVQSGAEQYGGHIIKKLGDGVLVEFTSAVNAVRCAVEVQQAIARHNAGVGPGDSFQIRIGIHVGDVLVAGGDILGDGVNVASRIEPLAEPGGICISRDVFDLVRSKVDIETVLLGPHELKNISRQIDIYRILIDAVAGSGARATVLPRRPRVRRWVWITAVAAAAVAILAGLAMMERNRRARAECARVAEEARKAAEVGKPKEALNVLKPRPGEFRRAAFQGRIQEAAAKVEDRAALQALKHRQRQLLAAIQSNDMATVVGMVDPVVVDKMDRPALKDKFRAISDLLKTVKPGLEGMAIDSMDLTPDRRHAKVHMRVQLPALNGGEAVWKPIPPSDWRLIDGVWYLIPDADSGGASAASRPPKRDARPLRPLRP